MFANMIISLDHSLEKWCFTFCEFFLVFEQNLMDYLDGLQVPKSVLGVYSSFYKSRKAWKFPYWMGICIINPEDVELFGNFQAKWLEVRQDYFMDLLWAYGSIFA